MAQTAIGIIGGEIQELVLPDSSEELMKGVVWGDFDNFFTPAFWAVQAWLDSKQNRFSSYKLGNSLHEEVAACLLGGHGIPSEVGLAAFRAIKNQGLLTQGVSLAEISAALKEPLTVGDRSIRYRFWRQKSMYLHQSLTTLFEKSPSFHGGKELRNWLAQNLPGVGPKTASWITRNWLSSDEVAIIDIHIHRAGLYAGFFTDKLSAERNYYEMEEKFLEFAHALKVRPAILDTLIWRQMKDLNPIQKVGNRHKKNTSPLHQPSIFELPYPPAIAVAL